MNRFRLPLLQLATALTMGLLASQAWADSPRQSATVSFGPWMTGQPLDRFPNASDTRNNNDHAMVPNIVTIKAGGSVNFIISGLHNIAIYDDGTEPEDINVNAVQFTTGTPNDVPIINDPAHRIYRGLDPSLQARDRVEVVEFLEPGTYLVICGVRPHFVLTSKGDGGSYATPIASVPLSALIGGPLVGGPTPRQSNPRGA